jgi:hypothetical protein
MERAVAKTRNRVKSNVASWTRPPPPFLPLITMPQRTFSDTTRALNRALKRNDRLQQELDEASAAAESLNAKYRRLKKAYKGDVYPSIDALLRVKNASFPPFADRFSTPQFLLIRELMLTQRR